MNVSLFFDPPLTRAEGVALSTSMNTFLGSEEASWRKVGHTIFHTNAESLEVAQERLGTEGWGARYATCIDELAVTDGFDEAWAELKPFLGITPEVYEALETKFIRVSQGHAF